MISVAMHQKICFLIYVVQFRRRTARHQLKTKCVRIERINDTSVGHDVEAEKRKLKLMPENYLTRSAAASMSWAITRASVVQVGKSRTRICVIEVEKSSNNKRIINLQKHRQR